MYSRRASLALFVAFLLSCTPATSAAPASDEAPVSHEPVAFRRPSALSTAHAQAAPAEPRIPVVALHLDGEPLIYEEIVTGGASPDAALPLVVVLHGLGDSPAGVRSIAQRYTGRARFVLPRAPTQFGPGFSWFPFYDGRGTAQQYADGVNVAARQVAAMIREVRASRPSVGKTVVTGFSQGGMVSFALAVEYPNLVDAALPVSGFLPSPLLPHTATHLPPIHAMHGEADAVVPLALDGQSVASLRALGANVTLRTYPGVPHTMTSEMSTDLNVAIAAALAP